MCNVYLRGTPKFPYIAQKPVDNIGDLDPDNTDLIHINVKNYKPRLPHKLAFQIIMKLVGKKVFKRY